MILGIDFDNTIIDYDNLFYRAGLSLGVLPDGPVLDKKTIRSLLVENGRENDWIRIQGLVYGKCIQAARVMEGFSSFLGQCQTGGWTVFIISHKTKETILGEKFNLHDSALTWLEKNRIFGPGIQGAVRGVFFELTREDKIQRINQLRCNIVVDDLTEVLQHPGIANGVGKILYDSRAHAKKPSEFVTISNWNNAYDLIARQYG
jgi:hypothetical protein